MRSWCPSASCWFLLGSVVGSVIVYLCLLLASVQSNCFCFSSALQCWDADATVHLHGCSRSVLALPRCCSRTSFAGASVSLGLLLASPCSCSAGSGVCRVELVPVPVGCSFSCLVGSFSTGFLACVYCCCRIFISRVVLCLWWLLWPVLAPTAWFFGLWVSCPALPGSVTCLCSGWLCIRGEGDMGAPVRTYPPKASSASFLLLFLCFMFSGLSG
jgi:hypothetical protein